MSDNNRTSSGKENDLSRIISSIEESIDRAESEDLANRRAKSLSEKPDIYFGSDPQKKQQVAKARQQASKAKLPGRAQNTSGKPQNVKSSQQSSRSAQGKPQSAKNAQTAKASQNKSQAQNKQQTEKNKSVQNKDAQGKRQAEKSQSKQQASKKADKPKKVPQKKNTVGQREAVAALAAAGTGSAAAVDEKKNRFTKKQTAIIGGLIAGMIFVVALFIVFLFNHYYNMLGGEQGVINNSEAMTYSDVDTSREDTIDKDEEDEKLKELMNQGEKISDEAVMNILLIAEDLRDTTEDSAGNTDVMMIISINTEQKTITMTSVMRDCYVNFQTSDGVWYATRLNAAYWHGGVSLLQSTIESYMNVEIDRYVLVNFNVFIDIVDTLGGLELTVTDEEAAGMDDPLAEQNKYLGNEKGTDYLDEGGDLLLNGNQTLAFARLRYVGNADYERTERQRRVIAEMITESRDLSIVEMDKLANDILPQIKTDITKNEAAQLLVDMLDYRNYEIQEMRVPADGTFTNEIISGMDVLSVDFNANAALFEELVYGTSSDSDEEDADNYNYSEVDVYGNDEYNYDDYNY